MRSKFLPQSPLPSFIFWRTDSLPMDSKRIEAIASAWMPTRNWTRSKAKPHDHRPTRHRAQINKNHHEILGCHIFSGATVFGVWCWYSTAGPVWKQEMRNHRTTSTYDMPCDNHIYPKISFSYSPAYERFVPEWASNGIWSVSFLNCLRCQNISASKCGRVGKVKCIDNKWCLFGLFWASVQLLCYAQCFH